MIRNYGNCPVARRTRSGFALVVTLAILALLIVTLVSYLAVMQRDMLATSAYSTQVKNEALAVGAADAVVADLVAQIQSNFRTDLPDGVYVPEDPSGWLPARNLTADERLSAPPLMAISRRPVPPEPGEEDGWVDTSGLGPWLRASEISTQDPNRQGRRIGPERWNAPRLAVLDGDGNLSPDFPVPDWIYVRDDFEPFEPGGEGRVTGRIAYAIYETGGLLDASVAGYPESLSPPASWLHRKGTPAHVNLSGLPGINAAAAGQLVSWRWPSIDWTGFSNWVDGGGAVAATPADGVNRFADRQEMIRFLDGLLGSVTAGARRPI